MRIVFSALLLTFFANFSLSQGPCSATPLETPLQLGDTTGLSASGIATGTPNCASYGANNSPEQWFTWTAPANGNMLLTTCPYVIAGAYANFNTSLAVYEGTSCSGLTYVACNGDGPLSYCLQFQSALSFSATCGTTYWIKVNGFESSPAFIWAAAFGLASQWTPTFQLALSSNVGSLQVDLTGAACGVAYFTAASFDAFNFVPGGALNGWWFGLHVSILDLYAQYEVGVPPFRGLIDGNGEATSTLYYPPIYSGLPLAAVSIVLDGLGTPIAVSPVATTTL
ncbi:MAG TPA: hypothetical protein PKA37_10090 [Planctomycetota bacterium]|nr:hypothetical protein [Planctomycetota bacterium]